MRIGEKVIRMRQMTAYTCAKAATTSNIEVSIRYTYRFGLVGRHER